MDTTTQEPAPAAPTAYSLPLAALAAVAGAVLFSLVFWATSEGGPVPIKWPEVFQPPVHLTPLFAMPLCLYWMKTGRLKLPGVLALMAVMTAAHWVAMEEAVRFATTSGNDVGHKGGLGAGLIGGAAGSFGTFFLIRRFGEAFRTVPAMTLMLIGIALLAALGAYGLGIGSPANLIAWVSGREFQNPEIEPNSLIVALYLPWQILYGLVLARLFQDHRPRQIT